MEGRNACDVQRDDTGPDVSLIQKLYKLTIAAAKLAAPVLRVEEQVEIAHRSGSGNIHITAKGQLLQEAFGLTPGACFGTHPWSEAG